MGPSALTNMLRPQSPKLSVVIPCYNEEQMLPLMQDRLVPALSALGVDWEVIFVDDGSRDRTREIVRHLHQQEPRLKLVALSRNFGHQAALNAGLAHAQGDAIAMLDADLQDPPELLAECLTKWREGADVVYAVRTRRKESLWKRFCYASFYRLLRRLAAVDMPLDSGDFCLIDRRVADVLRSMPEQNPFLRGLRSWCGFRQVGLEYERAERAAGETKYPLRALFRLASDGIFSFSTFPLRLSIYLGLLMVMGCLGMGLFVLIWRIVGFEFLGHSPSQVPGWAGATIILLFLGGVQLTQLGLQGEYIARIYEEVKHRPRWIEAEVLGDAPHADTLPRS